MTLGGPSGTEVDPGEVARAVLSCTDVVAMHGGLAGEAASYLPGQRIKGVRVLPDRVEVHVVVRWPVTAEQVAGQIRSATAHAVRGQQVDVVLGDVQLPDADPAPIVTPVPIANPVLNVTPVPNVGLVR